MWEKYNYFKKILQKNSLFTILENNILQSENLINAIDPPKSNSNDLQSYDN
jgi:hypothetical protein